MNQFKFDTITTHSEFAYGPNHVKDLQTMLDFPMLACNCYDEKTDKLIFPSHIIIERAGLKIGVIGIAGHIVDKTTPTSFSEGVYFPLRNEELLVIIKQLREVDGVDLIVVLSHFGFPQEVKKLMELIFY